MANLSSEYEFFAQWLSAAISCSLLLISLVRKVMDVAQHTGHFPFTCTIFNDIIEITEWLFIKERWSQDVVIRRKDILYEI